MTDKEESGKMLSLTWPQSSRELMHDAQRQSDLVKLIMNGTCDLESWLIPHRILPALADRNLQQLQFVLNHSGAPSQTASILPLPDGSAFACHVSGQWLTLDTSEASHEMAYIGSRFAPGDHWVSGFSAMTQPALAGTAHNLTPTEVAALWTQITGQTLHGFAVGLLDNLEAIGYGVANKVFNTQGRLGL